VGVVWLWGIAIIALASWICQTAYMSKRNRTTPSYVRWVEYVQWIEERLIDVQAQLKQLTEMEKNMSAEMDALTAQVAANGTVIGSAITMLQGIKAALDAAIASGNPAALVALSNDLGAQDAKLAQAVADNTPAPTA